MDDRCHLLDVTSPAFSKSLMYRRIGNRFINMWHSYAVMETYGFCYWCNTWLNAHEKKAALVNVWGTIYDVPCCPECFNKHDGVAREDL